MPRVIVIGAGISGLAFARTYLYLTNCHTSSPPKPVERSPHPSSQSNIPGSFISSLQHPTEAHDILIVDENPSLGGCWCRSRIYPNLYTQNVLGTYEFSDMPLEGEDVANEAGYIAGWKLEEYLVAWSEKWKLTGRMRFGVKVNTIYRDQTTNEWVLNIIHKPPPLGGSLSASIQHPGQQLKLYCDKLVLAIGTSSEPNKPYIPGQEFVKQAIIHSVELGDWSRGNLGIDINYHHKPSAVPPPKPVLFVDKIREVLMRPYEKPLPTAVGARLPPTSPHSPVTSPITPSPGKIVVIYGARKSAFDIVYFFAALPPHLRPEEIHWAFRPSASTPSRFAAPFLKDKSSFNLQLPVWIQKMLPKIPVRMDELMAVRLMGLFERCGFESSNGWNVSWTGLVDILLGIGWGKERKIRDVLGLHSRSWASWLLQETTPGRRIVNGLWRAFDKAWEAAEGILGPGDGDIYKLRPETSSGSCSTSFLITNQPDFWDIIRQPNIHIHRTGIKSILPGTAQGVGEGRGTGMQLHFDDGTSVSDVELLVMATGWKSSFPFTFDPPELSAKLGLPYTNTSREGNSSDTEIQNIIRHWESLEAFAQQRLKQHSHTPNISEDPRIELSPANLTLPLRLFRNMVSPELTASQEKDRSLLVLGMAKSWQTMIVSEVQALWGAAYLLGGFDNEDGENSNSGELQLSELGRDGIEERVAVFEEFSKGTGGGVLLVDSLKYCDVLLQDLGLNPWRKSLGRWSGWKDWVGVHRPRDYRGIADEWIGKRRMADAVDDRGVRAVTD